MIKMNIKIFQSIEGAKNATGLTVIIDVFRAFSVEAYCFSKGAKSIIPIGDSEIAYRLKEENPDMILAGERNGKMLPGFDLGNSPSGLCDLDLKDKTVIHTTSAGTQGVANAKNATEILGGSLVNAKATAEYIRKSGATDISLVCMGYAGEYPTDEDTLCAEYIKSLLLGKEIDLSEGIERLKTTDGAKFFDKSQNDVFPENDFYMCTKVDCFDFAIRLCKGEKLDYMEKIII
jgi:2-phosphosulfolactate phosphatase